MGATFVIFTITIGQAQRRGAAVPLLILGGAAFFAAVLRGARDHAGRAIEADGRSPTSSSSASSASWRRRSSSTS